MNEDVKDTMELADWVRACIGWLEYPQLKSAVQGKLYAIATELDERGWQPMETAPTHVTVLLDIPPFDPMTGVKREDGTWMVGARSIIGKTPPNEPEHWMPLPERPT